VSKRGCISLAFGEPEHGWLAVTLRYGEREHFVDASDVPMDSLLLLANAVLVVLQTDESDATVSWSLEPDFEVWRIRRSAERFVLSIRSPEGGEAEFVFAQGSAGEICAPIWRGLRRLQVCPSWLRPGHTWSHPFPERELRAIGVALGRHE
jgi:hypothetical protein